MLTCKRSHITFELTFGVVAVPATLLSCSAVLKVVDVMSLSKSRSPTLHLKANISTTGFGINDMTGTFCDNSADSAVCHREFVIELCVPAVCNG